MGILAREGGPHLMRADDQGYVEAVGERVALLGRARLECWMWPVKLFEDLEVCLHGEGQGLPLGPRTVHVVPEGLGLEWPEAGLSIEAFACRASRGLVLLVSVQRDGPVEVELRFRPALRPMWPAGMGGQITGRDDGTGAFLLTEELGRFAALIGAPEAEVIEAPEAPGAPEAEVIEDRGVRGIVSLRLPISPARAAKGPVPVIVAGAEARARPLTEDERRGAGQSATGTARSAGVTAAARELYRALAVGWPDELELQRSHWRDFLERTARLEVDGDPALERAFLWSKIAIERSWVRVDGIGRTLVAGLGPSFGGERPGFAWFFNGDAFVATRALVMLGDHQGCRDVFRFAAATQREDGKVAHEISLSADLCDWFGDYPYAYYKGQVTPGFVACLAHYVVVSGDLEFARELWPNVVRAIEWCRTTCDDQGRMRVPLAGIAAVEAGPVAGEIETEVYLQGIWLSGIEAAVQLAGLLELEPPEGWSEARDGARAGLETFWNKDRSRMAFAHLADGRLLDDPSAYVALPLARHLAPSDRDVVLNQNRPEVMADWGARMFATTSAIYDPEHYNTGSVFPYLTNFSLLALFRAGHVDAGWQVLRGQVALDGFDGLGYLPEFLAGDRARVLPRSVPHQVFSQATLLQGVLFGLLDLDVSGIDASLACAPYLPPGLNRIALRGLAVGAQRLDLFWNRHRQGSQVTLRVRAVLTEGTRVEFNPSFTIAPLSQPGPAGACYGPLPLTPKTLRDSCESEVCLVPGPELELPSEVRPGEPSRNPRLVARVLEGGLVHLTVAGPAGTTYGALTFPPGQGFTETTVTLGTDDA
jgi:hypothetical protein